MSENMTLEEFDEIVNLDVPGEWAGTPDEVFAGLVIMRKYLPNADIEDADIDEVRAGQVEGLLKAGLTREDAIELRKLGWRVWMGEIWMCHYID